MKKTRFLAVKVFKREIRCDLNYLSENVNKTKLIHLSGFTIFSCLYTKFRYPVPYKTCFRRTQVQTFLTRFVDLDPCGPEFLKRLYPDHCRKIQKTGPQHYTSPLRINFFTPIRILSNCRIQIQFSSDTDRGKKLI